MSKFALAGMSILAASFALTPVHAMQFGKPFTTPVLITNPTLKARGMATKNVTLMNLHLTEKEKTALLNRPVSQRLLNSMKLPVRTDLGMNNVPVLNQGSHGSCVTFANSAAVNAAVYGKEYVSPLCNLELGSHFEKNAYMPSGWNGSWGPIVLNQMMRFGIVSMATQREQGCAGIKEYPIDNPFNEGEEFSLADFRKNSEDLTERMTWNHLLSNDAILDPTPVTAEEMEVVLNKTKLALAKGHRVTFGTLLVMADNCFAGACAMRNTAYDTWALTDELNSPKGYGGHEMVIFAYDDNATAMDAQGKKHRGLFTLRNSWDSDVGDQGNFYMTYDFFKKYVMEVQEIIPLND